MIIFHVISGLFLLSSLMLLTGHGSWMLRSHARPTHRRKHEYNLENVGKAYGKMNLIIAALFILMGQFMESQMYYLCLSTGAIMVVLRIATDAHMEGNDKYIIKKKTGYPVFFCTNYQIGAIIFVYELWKDEHND